MLTYFTVLLTALALILIYNAIRSDVISTNISIQRYINLSKIGQDLDGKSIAVRLFLTVLNIFIILHSVSIGLNTDDLSLNYNTALISLYLVLDITLFYTLHLMFIKQRHEVLAFLRIGLLEMLMSLMILATISVEVQGVFLSDVLLFQNELSFGLPKWNIVLLMPLYYVWNASRVDTQRSLPLRNLHSEVDKFQMRLLYTVRSVAWLSLSVVLFFGGAGVFELFDGLNFNEFTLSLFEVIVYVIKFIILALLVKMYRRFVGPKKLLELENLYRRRTLLAIIAFLIICGYKVATL